MNAFENITNLSARLDGSEIKIKEAILEQLINADESNRVLMNHCLPLSEVIKLSGMAKNTLKPRIEEAIKLGVISPPIKSAGSWKYTPEMVHNLLDWLERPKWSNKANKTLVMNIENQKGGTGKSTTTVSLAVGLALDYERRMRILVIDLDPQGSVLSQIGTINMQQGQLFLSAVDLMLGHYDQSNTLYRRLVTKGATHEQIVNAALVSTHLPNLKILPAFPSDERFTSFAWTDETMAQAQSLINGLELKDEAEKRKILAGLVNDGGMSKMVRLLKETVIDPIRDQFDLIMIDTGPQINPLVWNANHAANCMLVPVSPRKLDWLSTTNFIRNLNSQLEMTMDDPADLQWFKILVTNYDDENRRDNVILSTIKEASGACLLNSQILRSSAFEAAARNYRTVHDMKKSDGLCPDKQFDKAEMSLRQVIREITLSLEEVSHG